MILNTLIFFVYIRKCWYVCVVFLSVHMNVTLAHTMQPVGATVGGIQVM